MWCSRSKSVSERDHTQIVPAIHIHIHTTSAHDDNHIHTDLSTSTPQTVITDYPAPNILSNLQRNIISAVPPTIQPPSRPTVQGHEWGVLDDEFSVKNKGRFTRVIAAGTSDSLSLLAFFHGTSFPRI